jgi:hypothetical protein
MPIVRGIEEQRPAHKPAGRPTTAQPVRRILRISIAQTPYPEPVFPVMTPAADPMNRAFAQSGQTSRPVVVFWKESRTLR